MGGEGEGRKEERTLAGEVCRHWHAQLFCQLQRKRRRRRERRRL